MQMNEYDKDRILSILTAAHCTLIDSLQTNHGGVEGAMFIGQRECELGAGLRLPGEDRHSVSRLS